MKSIVFLLLFFIASVGNAAEDVRVWNNTPLTIVLPVKQEVRVIFPTSVHLQVPIETTQVLESMAPNPEVVYWTALAPFDGSRVIATSHDKKTVYLVDLVAEEGADATPKRIEDPARVLIETSVNQNTEIPKPSSNDPAEIILTRFVSQSLYAPKRLIPTDQNIFQVDGVSLPADFPLLRSQKGERYALSVVGAWNGYGRYITAVMVTNLSDVSARVNPALVVGNFTHITSQHLWLSHTGSMEDRTTLYLISRVPFASAILEDGYGY